MKIWVVVVITIGVCMVSNASAKRQIPCFFVFGDSLSDSGNNNDFETLAKVNYEPYGIDFPDGPTGRFTNGRTVVDILGQLLGFENFIPTFASANVTKDILDGVNYASGSAGILKETGRHLGHNTDFRTQFHNHGTIMSLLTEVLGSQDKTNEHLSKCLYYVGLGSNDYINNYFFPSKYNTAKEYDYEQFANLLINNYRSRIMKLYKLGARKMVLSGIGRVGCAPNSLTNHIRVHEEAPCVDTMNEAVQHFNVKLLTMVDNFNSNLTDAKFSYINTYGMGGGDPSSAGFKVWDQPCCPVNEVGQCVKSETPCKNRREYVFWDAYHPTEYVNIITASRIYSAYDLSDCYPLDVSQLIQWTPSPRTTNHVLTHEEETLET